MFSANFALTEFSEVRQLCVLRSSALPWCADAFCALAHIHLPHTEVCCLRYVGRQRRVKVQDSYLSSS
jgi:hypothetical protein